MHSLWVGSPKKGQDTWMYIFLSLCKGHERSHRCRQLRIEPCIDTYSSVKERYVKMSACCKHWQQCHRNLLAGIVYIYGFSSRQPQWPAKKKKDEIRNLSSQSTTVSWTHAKKVLIHHKRTFRLQAKVAQIEFLITRQLYEQNKAPIGYLSLSNWLPPLLA